MRDRVTLENHTLTFLIFLAVLLGVWITRYGFIQGALVVFN